MALPIVSWPADVWGNIASHLTPLDILQFKILDPKLIIWSKFISPYGLDSLFFTDESHIIPCLTEFIHLRHLAINLPKLSINGLLSLLPSTLQTISFEFPSAMRIWLQHPAYTPRPISLIHFQYNAEAVNISALFPKLTRFRIIGRDWNQKQEDDPMPWPTHAREAFIRALPPSLTHFEIPSLAEMSSQLLCRLPPMLVKLRLGPSQDFNRSVPLWFIDSYWEKICISDTLRTIIFYDLSFTEIPILPPSLTSLEITTRCNPEGFLDDASGSQPLSRATHLREFTLKSLDVSDNFLTLELLQNVPTSITSLSLQQIEIFSSPDSKAVILPLKLMSFDLVMPSNCIIPIGKIILPKGLTRLSVVYKSWNPSQPYPLELPSSLLEFSGLEGLIPPIPQSVTKLSCLRGFVREPLYKFDFEPLPRGLKSLLLDVYYKYVWWSELPIADLPPGLTEFQAEATMTVPQVLALPKTLEIIVIDILVVSETLLPKNMETLHRGAIERAAIANGVPRCIFTSNFSLAGKPHQMQIELSVKQSPPGLPCLPYFSGKLRHINLRGVIISKAANWFSSLINFDQIVSIRTPHLRASSGAAFLNSLPKSITSFIMEPYITFDVMAVRSLPEGIRVFHAPQARLLIPPPASLESLIVLEVPRIFWDKLSSIKRVQVGHGP